MKKSLIHELDELENTHWWHKAKRDIFSHYIQAHIDHQKTKGMKEKIKILEIGAGAGNILAAFKDKAEVIALDPDESAIEYSKKRGITKTIQKTLEQYTDYKPESVDIIIAADVLEHIKDDKEAVKKIWGMLKKGGIFLVHVPADQSLFSYWDKALHHYRRYSKNQLNDVLSSQDFKIQHLFHRIVLPYPFVKVFRKIKSQTYTSENMHSDFKSFPMFNGIFYVVAKVEDLLAKNRLLSAPFGLSLFALARKK